MACKANHTHYLPPTGGGVPRNLGLGGRLSSRAYRCIKEAAGPIADAALEDHRPEVIEHCHRHSQFCEGGLWELPATANANATPAGDDGAGSAGDPAAGGGSGGTLSEVADCMRLS